MKEKIISNNENVLCSSQIYILLTLAEREVVGVVDDFA